MNKKKVFLFIVEGLSDKEALEPIVSELLRMKKIYFKILRCDLTAALDRRFYHHNMKERIKIVIDEFLEMNRGIRKADIEKLIYLTDIDGCYIASDYVFYSECDNCFRYEDDGIYTNRPETAIERNRLKSRNLNIINSTQEVYHFPIEVYYFSCNLDHVLHDERNMKQENKVVYAEAFADQYEGCESKFINYISDDNLFPKCKYDQSWSHIKQDLNSLLKYSNFCLFFFHNFEYLTEEAKECIDKISL